MERFLYKAKRKDNGEWVIGYYYKQQIVKDSSAEKHFIIVTEFPKRGQFSKPVFYEVDPATVCQCTGVKDKNGKLIWENDICDRKEEYPEIVKYNEGQWILDYSYASGKEVGTNYCSLGFYAYDRECVEVIGNIFDNPELLEQ